jgi:hypothetical protein
LVALPFDAFGVPEKLIAKCVVIENDAPIRVAMESVGVLIEVAQRPTIGGVDDFAAFREVAAIRKPIIGIPIGVAHWFFSTRLVFRQKARFFAFCPD